MNSAYCFNTAWMWSCRREARAFQRATAAVATTQERLLQQMLASSATCEFGLRYEFSSIHSVREYQQRVPLVDYEHFSEAMQRIASGRAGVLFTEQIELLEPTSGTNRGEKLIPYNATLRAQFQRAVATWIADLFYQQPALRHGRAYWSISPTQEQPRVSRGGVPIGFDDDAAYLGRLQQFMIRRILIMPAAVARLQSRENFQYCTLLHLLAAADMTLISVWSPTYLTSLLRPLENWSERLCHDLARGHANLPASGDRGESEEACCVPKQEFRTQEVLSILRTRVPLADKLRQLWPQLGLISCWADGTAATYVDELRKLFPKVSIQPKGLLATEAFVSIPLWGHDGAALALRSHFFEFIPTDAPEDIPRLAHQLELGRSYQVAVTTGGGLYRYRLGDAVEVVGFKNQCPLLRFIGRVDRVCDQVGEKLEESHVSRVLQRVYAGHDLSPKFSMLAPLSGNPAGYRLYLEFDSDLPRAVNWEAVKDEVESGLCHNPYYRHARQIGQLHGLDVCALEAGDRSQLWPLYEQTCLSRGLSLGDIKPTALDSWPGWPDTFQAVCGDRLATHTYR